MGKKKTNRKTYDVSNKKGDTSGLKKSKEENGTEENGMVEKDMDNKDMDGKNKITPEVVIKNIIDNYRNEEKSIVEQLKLYSKHGTTTGSLREDIWLKLFERIVPKKFSIEHSVFILDSDGRISNEVDLALVDQNYTPYIFQYGRLKYIPIEAVAAVVECKSTSPGAEQLANWVSSIKKLRTSIESVTRMAAGISFNGLLYGNSASPNQSSKTSAQTSTRPIRILCGYESAVKEEIRKEFDFVLIARGEEKGNCIEVTSRPVNSLHDWYMELNHYQNDTARKQEAEQPERNGDHGNTEGVKGPVSLECEILKKKKAEGGVDLSEYKITEGGEEVPLMSFNFLLNQLLMLINNPILFPHRAYARLFNEMKTIPEQEHQEA